MLLAEKIKDRIRDVKDFPKEGIIFKDITPVLADPELNNEIVKAMADAFSANGIGGIAGVESRGFIFGMALAREMDVPFIPIRKSGKLPYEVISYEYDLEYGSSKMEMHIDAVSPGQKVLIHDDLLATGGTAAAAAELIGKLKGEVLGFSFVVDLTFLNGRDRLVPYSNNIHTLVEY
ncbi:MAG: adenine phosphoribosyltransferase [Bacteroidota bacterium]